MSAEEKEGATAEPCEAPFFNALVRFTEKRTSSFHCPGHSNGEAFAKTPITQAFRDFFGDNMLRADICNAVEEMGQLLDHTGAAFEAERAAARVFGGDHLFFVTNGTSSSNKIVWHSQVRRDDIVVVDRNCHKSILHAIMMTGAIPIYLSPTRNYQGIIGPVPASEFTPASIRAKIEAHPLIKDKSKRPRMLALTQCTYDGIMYNTAVIKSLVDGVVDSLHFDEAWIPHAAFHPVYRQMHAIGGYAPMRTNKTLVFSTQSTHKTLVGLSQASQVVINDARERSLNRVLFNEAYLMHTTTSPQYSIIASCDVAAAMMDKGRGRQIMEVALKEAIDFRQALASSGLPFRAWGSADNHTVCDLDQSTWVLKSDDDWHGFGLLEDGFNMLDPLKITILNPGLDSNGTFSELGIPAQITTKYLYEHDVLPEKCGLYSFFVMFTVGITRARWQLLLDRLRDFMLAYEEDLPIDEVMPVFTGNNPVHSGKGLRTLCDQLHALYRKHDVARMTTEVYTSPVVPAMKPSDAQAKVAHEEIDRVEIDQLKGRITAVLLTPYPPGIPLLVPGEVISETLVRYLQFVRALNYECPGFETDVHGLVRSQTSTTSTYHIDCIREKAALDRRTINAQKTSRSRWNSRVSAMSREAQTEIIQLDTKKARVQVLRWHPFVSSRLRTLGLYMWGCINFVARFWGR